MSVEELFTENFFNGFNFLIAFFLVFSLTNYFTYILNESDSFKKNRIYYKFIQEATPDKLEAFWLSKKSKLSRKQKRYLERIRKNIAFTEN